MAQESENPKISPEPALQAPDEEVKLNAPDRPTLRMLAAISLATLLMWGAGRAACNYRVKGEGLKPRAISLSERTSTAKSAAFEWAQAMSSGNFDRASQLSSEEFKESLLKLQQDCTACDAAEPQSVATVVKRFGRQAEVRVETWVENKGSMQTLTMRHDAAGDWRVSGLK